MKTLLFILTLIISLQVSAQELFESCPETYSRVLSEKIKRKEKMATIGSQSYVASVPLMFTGRLEIVAGAMIIGGAMVIYSKFDPKEKKIQDFQMVGSKALKRLTKKVRNKVDFDISEEEVSQTVVEGLESGLYCEDYPKLYSAGKITKHVIETMESRYPMEVFEE